MKPLGTVYNGQRWGLGKVTVHVDGRPLKPRTDLRNHSPDGFEWGYGGSGPAQLSLAILADFLEDDAKALQLYQPFKWRTVAQWEMKIRWQLNGAEIADVVAVLESEMKGGRLE